MNKRLLFFLPFFFISFVFASQWESGTYQAGDIIQYNGKDYTCKPWPYTAWCGQRQPDSNGWQEAWELSTETTTDPTVIPSDTPTPQPTPLTPNTPTPTTPSKPSFLTPDTPTIAWMPEKNTTGTYSIDWNLWWGENGNRIELFENNVLLEQKILQTNTPNPQSGTFSLSNKTVGTYTYSVRLCQDSLCSESPIKTISVEDKIILSTPTPTPTTPSTSPLTPNTPTQQPTTQPTSPVDLDRIIATTRTIPGIPVIDLQNRTNNPENVQRVMRIISSSTWNEFFPARNPVYTYEEFLKSIAKFPAICSEKASHIQESLDTICAKEIATIFAHATQETGGHSPGLGSLPGFPGQNIPEWKQGLYHVREMGCENGGCEYRGGTCESHTWQGQTWNCPQGARYFGRGAKQLSYNYNYGPFSDVMFGDVNILLKDPDRVAREGWLALSSAMWFYVTPQSPKPSMHDMVTGFWSPNSTDIQAKIKPGFGATTNIINGGIECGGSQEDIRSQNRIEYYKAFTQILGVAPGNNLGCAGQHQFPAGGSGSIKTYWEKDWGFNAVACQAVSYQTPFTIFKTGDYDKCVAHHFGTTPPPSTPSTPIETSSTAKLQNSTAKSVPTDQQPLKYLIQEKITTKDQDTFKGDETVSRAEALAFVLRANNTPTPNIRYNKTTLPTDVPETSWHAPYISVAIKKGIASGYEDNTFKPHQKINRAEFLKILTLGLELPTNIPHTFTDVPAESWYDQFAGLASKYNLFTQSTTKKLLPLQEVTRNDVAQAIYNLK